MHAQFQQNMTPEDIIDELRTSVECRCPTVRSTRLLNSYELIQTRFDGNSSFWSPIQYIYSQGRPKIEPIDITRALSITLGAIYSLKQAKPDVLYVSIDSKLQAVAFFFHLIYFKKLNDITL